MQYVSFCRALQNSLYETFIDSFNQKTFPTTCLLSFPTACSTSFKEHKNLPTLSYLSTNQSWPHSDCLSAHACIDYIGFTLSLSPWLCSRISQILKPYQNAQSLQPAFAKFLHVAHIRQDKFGCHDWFFFILAPLSGMLLVPLILSCLALRFIFSGNSWWLSLLLIYNFIFCVGTFSCVGCWCVCEKDLVQQKCIELVAKKCTREMLFIIIIIYTGLYMFPSVY